MSRTVNEKEYAARRDQILDVAQRLVASRGYEQMTVRDVMDELKISKGTLYHYFGSKQAVLEALVERMISEAEQVFRPILEDSRLPALDKLNDFFRSQDRYRIEQQPLMLEILRVWYSDENAIVRQKVRTQMLNRMAPMLAAVIRQGVREGVFTTGYPDEAGEVFFSLVQDLVDAIASHLVSLEPDQDRLGQIELTLAAYSDAVERVLGAPSDSLVLTDLRTLGRSVPKLTGHLATRKAGAQ